MAKIAMATVVALIVAAVILVVAVLPAEYGMDPLGTGKKLGLTDLAGASAGTVTPSVPDATIMPVLDPSEKQSKWGASPTVKGAFISRPNRFNYDSREITLMPGEGTEVKYNMKQGSGLVFSWVASGKVLFDFHGAPDTKPKGVVDPDYFESYERDDSMGRDQFHATFVAPKTGIHGWFWENNTKDVVTIKLVSAGFYDWVFQNVKDKETALKVMDVSTWPSHPKVPDEVIP